MTEAQRKSKHSENITQMWLNPSYREKQIKSAKKRWQDLEERQRQSERLTGRIRSSEHRRNISEVQKKRYEDPEERRKASEMRKKYFEDPEAHKRHSAAIQGITIEEWNGFISFEPYCEKFNEQLKEQIRDQYGRACFICGKPESLDGRKLDVHHVDADKMQGCDGKKWFLVPLCRSCNSSNMANKRLEQFLKQLGFDRLTLMGL